MTTSTDVLAGPPEPLLDLLLPVLDDVAAALDAVGDGDLGAPTPCQEYDVAALRDHVLAWMQMFAATFADPDKQTERADPAVYRAADDARPARQVVQEAASSIAASVRAGVNRREVEGSSSRMPGSAVAGMYLGEYLIHGWDLRRALGLDWSPDERSCAVALEFLEGMILPEYRGGEHGYFAEVVDVAADAPASQRLLGFAGRDPGWKA